MGLEKLEHQQMSSDDYKRKLKLAQLDLLKWQRVIAETKSTLTIVIEGPDAAGKGGAIKRVVEKLDPRLLKIHSIVKPSFEENWRNRRHWKENVVAAEEMLARTSTERAPWHVIGANYKWHTRVKAVQTIVNTIDKRTLRESML